MILPIPEVLKSRVAFNAIRMYAALSYLYEVENASPAEDHQFDELCLWLTANYEWVKPYDINEYLPRIDTGNPQIKSGMHCAHSVCGQTKEFAESLKETWHKTISPPSKASDESAYADPAHKLRKKKQKDLSSILDSLIG